VQLVGSETVPQPSVALYITGHGRDCGLIVCCGCQRNAALDSEDSGFAFMLNPGVYFPNLHGFKLAELGTHEPVTRIAA
jgi:hypothetical protein